MSISITSNFDAGAIDVLSADNPADIRLRAPTAGEATAMLEKVKPLAGMAMTQAPIDKLERWRTKRGWDHTWVSSYDTGYHHDWGWTQTDDQGQEGQQPGYSYYLRKDGKPYLTYMTNARGTEAILPTAHIMDRTCYGRQQDWEDSPAGWPQYPTYG